MSKAALRSRRVRIEIEPESEAIRRSFKARRELSRYCVLGNKLIGRCAKDHCVEMTEQLVKNKFLNEF